jgi:signal transduction histidine kinase
MERFNRGDASRTIEGSGLGLTIAKDLMKLMGGWIDITIDGDLFKVKLMLKSAEQEKKPLIINEL